jgi:hypothetical protein
MIHHCYEFTQDFSTQPESVSSTSLIIMGKKAQQANKPAEDERQCAEHLAAK